MTDIYDAKGCEKVIFNTNYQ